MLEALPKQLVKPSLLEALPEPRPELPVGSSEKMLSVSLTWLSITQIATWSTWWIIICQIYMPLVSKICFKPFQTLTFSPYIVHLRPRVPRLACERPWATRMPRQRRWNVSCALAARVDPQTFCFFFFGGGPTSSYHVSKSAVEVSTCRRNCLRPIDSCKQLPCGQWGLPMACISMWKPL